MAFRISLSSKIVRMMKKPKDSCKSKKTADTIKVITRPATRRTKPLSGLYTLRTFLAQEKDKSRYGNLFQEAPSQIIPGRL